MLEVCQGDLGQDVRRLVDRKKGYGFFREIKGQVKFMKVRPEELMNGYLNELQAIYDFNKNEKRDYPDDAKFLDQARDDGVNRAERLNNFLGLCGKLFPEAA